MSINNLYSIFFSSFKKAFNKGLFHLVLANLSSLVLLFISNLVIVRFISPVELGQIKIIQSINAVAFIIGGLGLSTAVLKLCSDGRTISQSKSVLIRVGGYLAVAMSLVMIIFVFLAKGGLLSIDPIINKWYVIYVLVLPAILYRDLFLTYLSAIKKVKIVAFNQIVLGVISLILLPIFTYQWQLPGFIFGVLVIYYTSLVIVTLFIRPFKFERLSSDRFGLILNYAGWGFAGGIVYKIAILVDLFLLNYFSQDREVIGYYSVAIMFITVLNCFPQAVKLIAVPYFSIVKTKKDFMKLLVKYEILMVFINIVVAGLSFLFVPWIIKIAYGDKYFLTSILFRILVLKFLFWSSYTLISASIIGLGKIRYNVYSAVILLLSAVGFGYFGLTQYGPLGLAFSQAAAQLVAMLSTFFLIFRAVNSRFNLDL